MAALSTPADDLRGAEVLVKLPFPLGTGRDGAVVPAADEPLTLQETQVGLEFVSEGLVLVRVRVEQAK